jgi:hypothetical protein
VHNKVSCGTVNRAFGSAPKLFNCSRNSTIVIFEGWRSFPLNKTAYAFGRFSQLSERATFALVKELAVDCKEYVDVGANEGAFTFLVHKAHPQARLHWFEPDRQLVQRLAKNLTRNKIVAYGNEMAVAERSGTATFFKNQLENAQVFFIARRETCVPKKLSKKNVMFVDPSKPQRSWPHGS